MKHSRITAAAMPDRRPVAPLFTLIMLWPISAQPPMPPNTPLTTLAAPSASDSRFGWPRVSVISSINVSVRSDSIRPTPAITSAYGNTMRSVSHVIGTSGSAKLGKPPAMEPRSPTVRVSTPSSAQPTLATRMPTSVDGTALVMRGVR